MIIVELADAEAQLLLKLANQRWIAWDNRPRPLTDAQEKEYQAAGGAVSVLRSALEAI